MINQRKIALDALVRVGEDYAYSNIVLQKTFSDYGVSDIDKPFITALFYGVLDRKITLDYFISLFVKKPVSKITPISLNSLRLAIFQIMFMDKIPESAAVNESVKLVKNSKEKYNSGFVNAVLRNFLRSEVILPEDNSLKSLSIRYSCPEWIVESFINDYGIIVAESILSHFLSVPDITVRINSSVISDEEFINSLKAEGVNVIKADIPHAVIFESGVDVSSLKAFKNGLFYVQDIPSQMAVLKFLQRSAERILDMCSAPGGKAFSAALLCENSSVTACDIYEQRVELIRKGADRLGLKNIDFRVCDSQIFDKSLGLFDSVICDVPCSGLGVIRRKPEIKYKTDYDLNELSKIQSNILENSIRYLKKGGRLLYSTCTLRKAENEHIIRAFLDKHTNYELEYEYTFLPNVDMTDGFYFAVIKSR